jgi:hypothetical protein
MKFACHQHSKPTSAKKPDTFKKQPGTEHANAARLDVVAATSPALAATTIQLSRYGPDFRNPTYII